MNPVLIPILFSVAVSAVLALVVIAALILWLSGNAAAGKTVTRYALLAAFCGGASAWASVPLVIGAWRSLGDVLAVLILWASGPAGLLAGVAWARNRPA